MSAYSERSVCDQRKDCNLDVDIVAKETGISAKLINAIENSDKKPFSSVLSYRMTERKLSAFYKVKSGNTGNKNNVPVFLRTKTN